MKDRQQNEKNDFEKELEDIEEWQNNQFNPGHYIGTGRMSRPIRRIKKHPLVLIIIGMHGLIAVSLVLFLSGLKVAGIFPLIIISLLPLLLLLNGIKQIINKGVKH